MSTEGKRIDMVQGMDESGPSVGMTGMSMPKVDAESIAARVPLIARYVRYRGWPALKDAMGSGWVKAAMMQWRWVMVLTPNTVPLIAWASERHTCTEIYCRAV